VQSVGQIPASVVLMGFHEDGTPLRCIHIDHDWHHRHDVHLAHPDQGHLSRRHPQDRRRDDCRSVTLLFRVTFPRKLRKLAYIFLVLAMPGVENGEPESLRLRHISQPKKWVWLRYRGKLW
jgi:hypothetical protein